MRGADGGRKYFLISGKYEMDKFTEIRNKAHFVSSGGTYKIRENLHTDSFLLRTADNSYHRVLRVYEPVPVDYKAVRDMLPVSSLSDPLFVNLSSYLSLGEAVEMVRANRLLSQTRPDGLYAARIGIGDVIKTVCYMQTLGDTSQFRLYDDTVRDWAINHLSGSSAELGFFVLQLAVEEGRDFMGEWVERDLYEPNVRELMDYIEERGPDNKDALLEHLGKLL